MERNKTIMNGFTLTEILIVLFIISLLTGITFANYRQGGKMMALQRSAYKLAQDIRRAQEMAIGARECKECTPVQIPPRYGIYSPKPTDSTYLLFADVNNDGLYNPAVDKIIATTSYESGVNFINASGTNCTGAWPPAGLRRVHLTFSPPDPKVELIVGWPPQFTDCAEIIMTLSYGSVTTSVRINQAGLIEIQ